MFSDWYENHLSDPGSGDPSAMVLSTASPSGEVSSRIVLLKEFSPERGFVFFTNYESRKAGQLELNNNAALLFYWPLRGRQIRVEGRVEKVSAEESDSYFMSRPAGSRLGAWASNQSREISSRKVLEERLLHFQKTMGENIPRPPHWGGYRLMADRFEFWQEGKDRLHDRLLFIREAKGWRSAILAP